MLRQRNMMTVLVRHGMWLVMALVAIVLILNFASLASAQESVTPFWQRPTLTAESVEGAIELEWVAVQDAVRYELWATAGNWFQIGGENLTGTFYKHDGLTRGAKYTYAVKAIDAEGKEGPWSLPIVSVAGPILPAPVLAATLKEGVNELEWSAVPGAARYEAWAYDGEVFLLDDAIDSTRYQHSSATAGTEYLYTVAAIDDEGIGGFYSAWVEVSDPLENTATPTATATAAASTATPTATATAATSTATPTATAAAATSTATPTATSTATPTPTIVPTATPTATPTLDSTLKCTLVGYAGGEKTLSSTGLPLIQNETLVAYREKFGEDAKDLDIVQVDYYTDGRVEVWYLGEISESKIHRIVSEQFQGCVFIRHTPWQDLSDD